MPSFAIDNSQWREKLAAVLPPQLRALLQGASSRDLLKKVDASFLLFDDKIVHLETRKTQQLEHRQLPGQKEAKSIAAACAQLLAGHSTEFSTEQRKDCAALLLLPANYFVATTTKMPGLAKDNLVAALKIQADSILPSLEEPLSLAINPASASKGDEHLALWVTESILSELFDAFAEQDIFLAAVKPRFMNAHSVNTSTENTNKENIKIRDVDAKTETSALIENNILKSLLTVPKQDLQQDVFQQQWQESQKLENAAITIDLREPSDYFQFLEAQTNQEYCFFPYGALNVTRRSAQGRQYIAAAAAVVVW